MGTDRLLPAPPRLGNEPLVDMKNLNHSMFLRVKLEHSCSASAVENRDHIITEYRDLYHCKYNKYIIILIIKSKQLTCLVSQPIENRPLRGPEVTLWKYTSAK